MDSPARRSPQVHLLFGGPATWEEVASGFLFSAKEPRSEQCPQRTPLPPPSGHPSPGPEWSPNQSPAFHPLPVSLPWLPSALGPVHPTCLPPALLIPLLCSRHPLSLYSLESTFWSPPQGLRKGSSLCLDCPSPYPSPTLTSPSFLAICRSSLWAGMTCLDPPLQVQCQEQGRMCWRKMGGQRARPVGFPPREGSSGLTTCHPCPHRPPDPSWAEPSHQPHWGGSGSV